MKKNPKSGYRILFSGLSPWAIIGAVVVLLSIVTLMAMEDISRQKKQSVRLMVEKGAALIRSFEAGTRMGMRGGHGSGFELQRLLAETAAQADITHLVVVLPDGTVTAHSEPDQVGRLYGTDLDLKAVCASGTLFWRRQIAADGIPVFEVFGKFAPFPERFIRPRRNHPHGMTPMSPPHEPMPGMVIFVGFHTNDIDTARAASIRQTLVMAAILLLSGFAGVLLLFRVQSERATRSSLAQAQALSDNLVSRIPIGLMAVDPDGRITLLNRVAASILQLTPANVMGRPAEGRIPLSLLKIVNPPTDWTSNATTGLVEQEMVCDDGKGHSIPMDVSAANLIDDRGNCFGRVILIKDLTEIHVLRQELEKNRRLALMGQLAAGVAHEIRNPLSSIKGFAVYFREKYGGNDADREVADILIQEVDRLNRVVGQLLEFSHPIKPYFQKVALEPFFSDSVRQVESQCRDAGVNITVRFSSPGQYGKMDVDKMRQVMLNLYLNALDAMPDGGELTVAVSEDSSGWIQIQVQDTGGGIAPEDRARIFEPYFSTKKSGTGLGLAIVQNIIRAHGGEIRALRPIGGGTRIDISLPPAKEM